MLTSASLFLSSVSLFQPPIYYPVDFQIMSLPSSFILVRLSILLPWDHNSLQPVFPASNLSVLQSNMHEE